DVDWGGRVCQPWADGKGCLLGGDCQSHVCSGSICSGVCQAGQVNCGGVCRDLTSDPQNCGACGQVCALNATCSSGVCVCQAGTANCGNACADMSSDRNNCGACGNASGTTLNCGSGHGQVGTSGDDGVKEGGERQMDCGGTLWPA